MDKPTATFTMHCWGCNKQETHPYTCVADIDKQTEICKQQGWRQVLFGPGAEPWFCSEDCALHSYNACRAKEWWDNHQ